MVKIRGRSILLIRIWCVDQKVWAPEFPLFEILAISCGLKQALDMGLSSLMLESYARAVVFALNEEERSAQTVSDVT